MSLMPEQSTDRSWKLPPLGENPSTARQGTTPGSFANPGRVGSPQMYSSPDTPGMPGVSDKTAWDFLPTAGLPFQTSASSVEPCRAITQLEHAREGTITREMSHVATREPHLTA